MSVVATIRTAISAALAEAESRVTGVLEATEGAVVVFVNAVFDAACSAVKQVVITVFDLTGVVVTEAFNVAESVATAALGDVQNSDNIPTVDEILGRVDSYDKEAD